VHTMQAVMQAAAPPPYLFTPEQLEMLTKQIQEYKHLSAGLDEKVLAVQQARALAEQQAKEAQEAAAKAQAAAEAAARELRLQERLAAMPLHSLLALAGDSSAAAAALDADGDATLLLDAAATDVLAGLLQQPAAPSGDLFGRVGRQEAQEWHRVQYGLFFSGKTAAGPALTPDVQGPYPVLQKDVGATMRHVQQRSIITAAAAAQNVSL
jgi:QLQ